MSLSSLIRIVTPMVLFAATGLGCVQNTWWTVERDPSLPTYRVVAYGDSIFSGLYAKQDHASVDDYDPDHVIRRAAPYVAGEYLGQRWNSNIRVVRMTKAGAMAHEVFDRIVSDAWRMQYTNTRVVMFEMCGSSYLQARANLFNQSQTCDYGEINNAFNQCLEYMGRAMRHINDHASPNVTSKIIMNLYYPGYAANNSLTTCVDDTTGRPINGQNLFLRYLARSNWHACSLAEENGFQCADAFAEMMGADTDTNEDGMVDSEALRYVKGESMSDYVNRITVTLRSTLSDANRKISIQDNQPVTYDYILNDNIHLSYYGNLVPVDSDRTLPPDFSDSEIVDGKILTLWNRRGHERLGWLLSQHAPDSP